MNTHQPVIANRALIAVGLFIYLLSPSCYDLWQASAPTTSALLPPLTIGERLLQTPQVILDLIGYWFWPMGREPMTITIQENALMRQGLFYWLILILVVRFCWRLRRIEPWLLFGMLLAIIGMAPFSGMLPSLARPFSHTPLFFGGIGLTLACASLFVQALREGKVSENKLTGPRRLKCYAWRFTAAVIVLWLGALSLNLLKVMGRDWPERVEDVADHSPDLVIAVEKARQLGRDGSMQAAETLIIRCGQAAPWYPEIPLVKAEMLVAQGEYAAAQAHLDRAAELSPDNEGVRLLRAKIEALTAATPSLN